jgi:hypothetical protein
MPYSRATIDPWLGDPSCRLALRDALGQALDWFTPIERLMRCQAATKLPLTTSRERGGSGLAGRNPDSQAVRLEENDPLKTS